MLRFAVNELTTFRWTLEEDLENYASLGVQNLGVWRHKLSDCGEDCGIDLIAESGMEVSSTLWAGGFTGSDGRSHRESIADGIEAIQLAAAVQANCLIAYTGGRGGHTRKHARRLALTALRELSLAANDLDVTLAIEPMHPGCGAEWTFLHQLDDTLEFISEIDNGGVRLVFDTYHFGHDADVIHRLPDFIHHIGLVHLGDAKRPPDGEQDRCRLGHGEIPLYEILVALQENGYDGFCELELLGQEIELFNNYPELIRESMQTLHMLMHFAN